MRVPFLDLHASYIEIRDDLETAIIETTRSGQYIGGDPLNVFECAYSEFVRSSNCVGVANGLDALVLSLKVLNIGAGDEVIVPANTFIATWLAVSHVGAIPIPIDSNYRTGNIDTSLIEEKITNKTKAIIAVHLYGQPADLDPILSLARKHGIYLIEDAAQAHGAKYKNREIGCHGDLVAWSFYPGKNLGALGDGGAITTNSEVLAESLRKLRNYGSSKRYVHQVMGINSRLDTVQAAILNVKLGYLKEWNLRRSVIAATYNREFQNLPITVPYVPDYAESSWHLYCVRHPSRDQFRDELLNLGIETLIHYPIPPHLQDAYTWLNYDVDCFPVTNTIVSQLVSLPIGPAMQADQVGHVVECVKKLLH